MILSESNSEFIKAFFMAREMISGKVKKGAVNKAFDKTGNTRYADLSSVFDTITPALNDQGIIAIQNASMNDLGRVEVYTILMHKSGESAKFVSVLPLGKADAQGYGSTFTYGRRYALMGIFGLVPADDDGNGARKTASDVKKAMDSQPDEIESIFKAAKQYFAGDTTSINVISAHYEKLKSDKIVGEANTFTPLKPAKKQQAEPVKAREPSGESLSPEIDF